MNNHRKKSTAAKLLGLSPDMHCTGDVSHVDSARSTGSSTQEHGDHNTVCSRCNSPLEHGEMHEHGEMRAISHEHVTYTLDVMDADHDSSTSNSHDLAEASATASASIKAMDTGSASIKAMDTASASVKGIVLHCETHLDHKTLT